MNNCIFICFVFFLNDIGCPKNESDLKEDLPMSSQQVWLDLCSIHFRVFMYSFFFYDSFDCSDWAAF